MSDKQWEVYPNTVRAGDLNGYDVRDRDQPDKRVCQRATKEDATAIAALPDLLEACRAVLDAIEKTNLHGEVIWIDWGIPVHESASERLQAVIAKATGANQ